MNPAEDSKSNEKLLSENEVLDLTVKQSRLHIERKCRDETIELLHQSKSLIEKLKLENERLKKTVDVLQKTVQFKNEEIDSKNSLINKLFEKGLQQFSTEQSFNVSVPNVQEDLNLTKDVVEDLDIDSLLKANLGEVNFDEILDMSGFPTDLPDVSCSVFEEEASCTNKLTVPTENENSQQVPNRDDGNVELMSRKKTLHQEVPKDSKTKDPNIIERLVDQKKNVAFIQKKVSPIKIVVEKSNYQLLKRKTKSPPVSPAQKKQKLDFNSSLACPHCNKQFPLGGNWKLKKHISQEHNKSKSVEVKNVPPPVTSNTTKTPNRKRKYTCNVCDKDFSFQSVLTAHGETHKTVTPWSCTFCHKEFDDMTELVNHAQINHGIKNVDSAIKVLNM